MSSRNNTFECVWQRSDALLGAYVCALALALFCLSLLQIPLWASAGGTLLCLLHARHQVPALTRQPGAEVFSRLRRDATGWQLWHDRDGWQPVRLRRDSMALPRLVILRFHLTTGNWLRRRQVRSVCITGGAMAPDEHRRLRLQLKFSRRRWAAPE